MLDLFPLVDFYGKYTWATLVRLFFDTIKYHVIMDYLTRLSIKDYPNISSEMDKFVCYSQPASDASSLEIRLTEVDDW